MDFIKLMKAVLLFETKYPLRRNRLSPSTRLAPRPHISIRHMLTYTFPVGFALLGIFLTQMGTISAEEHLLNEQTFSEMILEEGLRGFMP